VVKTQFKVGSLDQLLELVDKFAKNEVLLDNSCKRNEKQYFDMCKELQQQPDLMMELVQQKGKSLQVSVEDFI